MNSFFTNIHSSIGWFGIIILILALATILFFARKHIARMRIGVRDFVFFPLLAGIVWLAITAFGKIGSTIDWVRDTSRAIAASLESTWWTAILVIAIIVIIIDFFVPRKSTETWADRWNKWRPKFYFALLWTVVIGVMNLSMSHLEIEAWQDLWSYKGTGSWFFSLIMTLLVLSMVLIVNVEMVKLRWCGGVLLFIALASWTKIAWMTDRAELEREAALEQKRLVENQILERQIRSVKPVLIPKGSSPVRLVWRDIAGLSNVPIYFRYNEKGDYELVQPGTVGSGPLHNLDAKITIVEIKSPDYDIEVYYKADNS